MPLHRFPFVACLAAAALVASAVGCNRESKADLKAATGVVAQMRLLDAGGPDTGGGDTGTGWGTLKGRFIYTGAAPGKIRHPGFDPKKDPLCNIPVDDETLVVDPNNKGLANVLIFLTQTRRVHPDYVGAPQKVVEFDQKQCRFLNHVAGVSTKDKWVILNGDETGHNAAGSPGRGNPSFNPLLPARVGRYEYPGFKTPLTVPFEVTCAIHSWMKSYVIARPDPYFAVTGTDGSFTIEKLPAGTELEFQVWHERAPGGLIAKPEWNRGRVKLTIPADGEVVTLDVPVDPSALQ